MDTDLNLSIVVAVDQDGLIGIGDELPSWDLKTDLKLFAKRTKGHMVIVGRKTHESILERLGHPLKDRETVVLTRQKDYPIEDWTAASAHSWEEAINLTRDKGEVFVIGGAEIYRIALPYTKRIYLTEVSTSLSKEIFFPSFEKKEWELVSSTCYPEGEKDSHPFKISLLERAETGKSGEYVNLANSRVEEQQKVMKEIIRQGICPFCPENFSRFHHEPILKQTPHWILTKNQWPYENTRIHLLLIYTKHIESIGEMDPEAGREFVELARWAEKKYQLQSGALAIGMRFGDPIGSGATVKHLHAQILSAKFKKGDPNYKPVRFRAG